MAKEKESDVMRFRLLNGTHIQGGKIYTKGDIVESKDDLTRFVNKFKRIWSDKQEDEDTDATPDVPAPVGVHDLDDQRHMAEEKAHPKEEREKVTEVSDLFPRCRTLVVQIYKGSKGFYVFPKGKRDVPLNEEPLKRASVDPFLAELAHRKKRR